MHTLQCSQKWRNHQVLRLSSQSFRSTWEGINVLKKLASWNREQMNLNQNNSKDTSSSNTLERATNQNDLLNLMCIKKEENKEDLIIDDIQQSSKDWQKETIKPLKYEISNTKIIKPSIKKREEKRQRNSLIQNDHISKSYSNIEKDLKIGHSKLNQNEIINKSLKLLKKRPNSAKTKNINVVKEENKVNHLEEIKEIMSKVKLLKSKKGVDSTNIITDQNALVSKPPPLPKSQRSEYFSQVTSLLSLFIRETKGKLIELILKSIVNQKIWAFLLQ